MTAFATGLGTLANSAEFIPYVYGAASGRPSKGRPEKVLANPDLPETPLLRLASAPETAPAAPGRPRTADHGSPGGAQRHYRDKEKPCAACLEAARTDSRERQARRRAMVS